MKSVQKQLKLKIKQTIKKNDVDSFMKDHEEFIKS